MFEVNEKYAKAVIYAETIEGEAVNQIVELCCQPMFGNSSIKIMPDCHSGKGCVIGFTSILSKEQIVPNLVGVDIGCGVLTVIFDIDSEINFKELEQYIRENVPSGFSIRTNAHNIVNRPISDNHAMKYGAKSLADCINIICDDIDESADKRMYHLLSVGSLGGGNHYCELGKISEKRYALSIHTGSRNLGKRICEFYQNKASVVSNTAKKQILEKHKTARTAEEHMAIQAELENLPKIPKDLAYLDSEELFNGYIKDMLLAKVVAAGNREGIAEVIMSYLISHNGAKVEEQFHTIHNYIDRMDDGKIIIRKGAIDASYGKKVAIPLNMRDGVILGIGKGNADWNFSAPHGAGRLMSRSEAKRQIQLDDFRASMEGINTWSVNAGTIDESPQAYKSADEIIKLISPTVEIQQIIKPVYNFKASE